MGRVARRARPTNDLHTRHVALGCAAANGAPASCRDVRLRACAGSCRSGALSLVPGLAALAGCALLFAGVHLIGLVLVLTYGAALVASSLHAALRFRSSTIGLLQPFAV